MYIAISAQQATNIDNGSPAEAPRGTEQPLVLKYAAYSLGPGVFTAMKYVIVLEHTEIFYSSVIGFLIKTRKRMMQSIMSARN